MSCLDRRAGCLFGALFCQRRSLVRERARRRDVFRRDRADRVRTVRRLPSSRGSGAIQPADVRGRQASRASLIAQATKARLMPPWKSEPGYGEFIGHRQLTDAEIDLIERWVAAGAPEGDPRRSAAAATCGPTAGSSAVPDLTVSFPEPFVVPADGPDFSRIFVLRLPVDRAALTSTGFEFRPGNGGVVHHANIRIDRDARARASSTSRTRRPDTAACCSLPPCIRTAISSGGLRGRWRRSCRTGSPGA